MSDNNPGRQSKERTVEEAIAELVPSHAESLWVGGMHMHNVPMALVRECIRQGKRFGTLYAAPSASFAADLLIGAGLVERVVCGYLGFEHLGLAPAFRRAAEGEAPTLEITDVDSGSLTLGLQAGAWGQPFAPLPPGVEATDLPGNATGYYKQVTDPFTGDTHLAVAAIRPQIALIHCQQADEYGNGIFKGSVFTDRLLAMSAETVLLQVEGLVDNNQILKYPLQTGIPAFLVASVSAVNFGCHPTSSHRYYNFDDVHLRLYMESASSQDGFKQYIEQFITGPQDQDEYMRRVQNQQWDTITG